MLKIASHDIHKFASPNNIPTHLSKERSSYTYTELTILYYYYYYSSFSDLHQCQMAKEWKIAKIVPIHKKVITAYP